MTSDSEPRKKFFEAPRPLQKSHFGGSKCSSTAISIQKKTLANCNKASIMKSSAHHRNRSPLNRPNPDFYTLDFVNIMQL